MRSDRLVVAALVLATTPAYGQATPVEESAPTPTVEPTSSPEPTPIAEPAPTVVVEPTGEPAPLTQAAVDEASVEKKKLRKVGFVFGFEAGFGSPGGTSAAVFGNGRGSGFMIGAQAGRFSIEWHLLQSYALEPEQEELRAETTLGTLKSSSILVRARLLELPIVEVMAGPALLSTPIYVIGQDEALNQRIEASPMDGLGVIAGAAVGVQITRHVALSLELRAVLASRWELPGRVYVIPGEIGPDGGRMYTTSREDATGSPRTATVLVRLSL